MKTTGNIPRPLYMEQLRRYYNTSLIKTVTGQRRVGKSYILQAAENELRQLNPNANFLRINLEDFAFSHITSAEALHQEIQTRLASNKMNYIFIDEVQEVEDFDKVLRSLILQENIDLYVTGSNSTMLSAEINSRLAGRNIEVHVHPLTYDEFIGFHNLASCDDSINLYLRYGGMPYLRNLVSTESWNEYLMNITDALVYRNIVARHSLRNNDFLQRLLMFIADNIGRQFTAKRISDYLKAQRSNATVTGVQNYVDYICQAYIANRCRRWDIEGKRLFEIGEKFYFEDLGIRNAIIGYRPGHIGSLLENAVYNHLRAHGYEVKTGQLPDGHEIDFIAEKGGERVYIQVALNVDTPETIEREFGNLAAIHDDYPKIVVTLRDSMPNTRDGIRMMNLEEILTHKVSWR